MKIQEKYLANISVISVCALLWIWVLPDTIALRNILLGIGAMTGALLIWQNRIEFLQARVRIIPMLSLASIFIWVIIHYLFFSMNPALELGEIQGLWARTLAGYVMAIGVGVAFCRYKNLQKYFFISIFSVPLINVLAYLYASYLHGGFIKPNDFVFFLFAKIETVFFGGIAGSIAVTNLAFLFFKEELRSSWRKILFCLGGVGLILISALISSTKNGIAIALILNSILVVIVFVNALMSKGVVKLFSLGTLIFTVSATWFTWQGHQNYAYKGWDTVLQDAKIAMDIDANKQWQTGHYHTLPLNSLGKEVAVNTYERFSYAMVGIRLIQSYPMGFGSINLSFRELQNAAKIAHAHQGQVHSGWIDFGLAYGIPGLTLIFLAMLSIIMLGCLNPSLLNLCSVMLCIALIFMGVIAEITYKQYFEATIFFIALAATFILLDQSSNKKSNDQKHLFC